MSVPVFYAITLNHKINISDWSKKFKTNSKHNFKKANNTIQQTLMHTTKFVNTKAAHLLVPQFKLPFTEKSIQRLLLPKRATEVCFLLAEHNSSDAKQTANNTEQYITQVSKYVRNNTKQHKTTKKSKKSKKTTTQYCAKHRTKNNVNNTKPQLLFQNAEQRILSNTLVYFNEVSKIKPYKIKWLV